MSDHPLKQKRAASLDDEAKWAAVVKRDAALDGAFVFSVSTTGIYCRPSCPARRALRKNVSFYVAGADARQAGYRPCKRCHPDKASLGAQHAAAVTRACRLIAEAEEMPSLDALAAAADMSRYHFHRVFKSVTGLTPKVYAKARQARRVRDELVTSGSVTAAMYDAGFNSSGRFYADSKKILGMTPTSFRSGAKGETIRFAVGECKLGSVLAAVSEKGVCAILLGDDPQALVRDLQDRFPKAQLIGGDCQFEQWMAKIVGFVEAPKLGLDLPLDIRGTAFQHRVWHALSQIPVGSTATYSEVAQQIGAPKSVRAIAQACAANKLAVAIPCHRVVKADGSLSGYRWGVARKRDLITREAEA